MGGGDWEALLVDEVERRGRKDDREDGDDDARNGATGERPAR